MTDEEIKKMKKDKYNKILAFQKSFVGVEEREAEAECSLILSHLKLVLLHALCNL